MYTFEQLKADVKTEADNLKVHATKEELGRLAIELLDPADIHKCYYGLMAESCHSDRAVELIEKCACRYIKDPDLVDIGTHGFIRIQKHVNGSFVPNFKENRTKWSATHYSAIEAYILLPEAKNANLIAYLKGETETLEL